MAIRSNWPDFIPARSTGARRGRSTGRPRLIADSVRVEMLAAGIIDEHASVAEINERFYGERARALLDPSTHAWLLGAGRATVLATLGRVSDATRMRIIADKLCAARPNKRLSLAVIRGMK